MPYIGYLIILDSKNIFELPRLVNCISRLCPRPLGTPPPPLQHPNRVKNT